MSKSADKTAGIVGVKESVGDHVFNVFNTILMILISIVIVYPLWYVILASITDPAIVNSGKFLLIPTGLYVSGYEEAFDYPQLWSGYLNSIIYTIVGVVVALVATIPGAYALSRRDMAGRKGIMFLFTFTMFFNGGMIPLYLTIKAVNIYNTMWAIVLPIGVSVYNLIVCRSFSRQTFRRNCSKLPSWTAAPTSVSSSRSPSRCLRPSLPLWFCSMRPVSGTSTSTQSCSCRMKIRCLCRSS